MTLPQTAGRALSVQGEIKTIACREGSSGIFTGSLEGLYQGYRFGSTEPDERQYTLDAPHGTIAVTLRQEIVTPLPPRPFTHPFADGRDPFAKRPATVAHAEPPGREKGEAIFKRVHYMKTSLVVDPGASTGIFAGATGETEFFSPNYQMAGYLVIETADGDLCLTFLEQGRRDALNALLEVDGARSSGRYAGAAGDLEFALTVTPPFFGQGVYSGTIILAEERSA